MEKGIICMVFIGGCTFSNLQEFISITPPINKPFVMLRCGILSAGVGCGAKQGLGQNPKSPQLQKQTENPSETDRETDKH